MAYSTTGADFDGANDYITHSSALTGLADSKKWSGSFWFKRGSTDANHYIQRSSGDRTSIRFNSSNKLEFVARNSTPTIILEIETSAITDTASWHHCLFSFDLADTNKRHIYVDDVSDLADVITYTDDTIDFTAGSWFVGAATAGTNKLDACLADFWWEDGVFFDFSTVSERRKFVTAGVKLVDLGSDGSTPNGTSPIMFFKGPGIGFETNLGTGGNFTETGDITDCADDPPSAANIPDLVMAPYSPT